MDTTPEIVLPARSGDAAWIRFRDPVRVVRAVRCEEVLPALAEMEQAVTAGLHAVGFLCYEAAPGLDPAFVTQAPGFLPLLWFGLFEKAHPFKLPPADSDRDGMGLDWQPTVSRETYRDAITRIRECLRAGDTYQVNYTFRMRAAFEDDPFALFLRMQQAQQSRYAVYIETDDFAISSVSPELFFAREGDHLISRPMKGTAPRGLTSAEDDRLGDDLQRSPKNRAENVMIVDMVRNDMGRVAIPGSVRVPHLYEVERYPTVWQMTSTVESRTQAPLTEVMRALFPCASITGAPKVQTMHLIRELESTPRGVYTGCMGHVAPNGRAWFNVAIRTVVVDKARGRAEYGVGGGVVWDSREASEYRECLTKAAVLTARQPEFALLETLLWEGEKGGFLLERHLARLAGSARYFNIPLDLTVLRERLAREGAAQGACGARIRVEVARDGSIAMTSSRLDPDVRRTPWRVVLAPKPIDRSDCFLYHKTTHRAVYGSARRAAPEADDVLLWNADGEVTESTIANVVVELAGRKVTPPVRCGLLAGVFRAELLARGAIEEAPLTCRDVWEAESLWLINSVRKWVPARCVD